MEISDKRRRCVHALYLGLSLLLALVTQVQTLQMLGLFPRDPDSSNIGTAIDGFNNYTAQVNQALYDEIFMLYNQSLAQQKEGCDAIVAAFYTQENTLLRQAALLSTSYCERFINKTWDYLEQEGFLGETSSLKRCDENEPFNEDPLQRYMAWFHQIPGCTSNGINVEIDEEEYCFYGMYRQLKPVGCSDSYTFDNIFILIPGTPFTRIPSDLQCKEAQRQLTLVHDNAVKVNPLGFTQSVIERLRYDYEYFVGVSADFGRISRQAVRMNAAFPTVNASFDPWTTRLKGNAAYMNNIYGSYRYLSRILPSGLFPTPTFRGGAPDLSIPPVPDAALLEMNASLAQLELQARVLEDYNPPEVTLEGEAEVEPMEPEQVQAEYNPPQLSFRESELLDRVGETYQDIAAFVSRLVLFDMLLRLAAFLEDASVLLLEPRREVPSKVSAAKQAASYSLRHSTLLFYIGLMVYLVLLLSDFRPASNFVANELEVQCKNDVLVQNAERLSKYQNDVQNKRSQCDAVIQTENSKVDVMNREYADPMLEIIVPYENQYRSSNPSPNYTFIAPYVGEFTVTPMSLPPFNGMERAQKRGGQEQTPIELYTLNSSVCDGRPEAMAVDNAFSKSVQDVRRYAIRYIIVGLGSFLAVRLLMTGFQLAFWMELTRGYSFDKPIHSDLLKERIRQRRNTAVGMAAIAIGIIVTILVVSIG